MPITTGYTAKLVTIGVGAEKVTAHVWPAAFIDECYVASAGTEEFCKRNDLVFSDKVTRAYISAAFVERNACQSDGKPLFSSIKDCMGRMTSNQIDQACNELAEAQKAWEQELDLGNP